MRDAASAAADLLTFTSMDFLHTKANFLSLDQTFFFLSTGGGGGGGAQCAEREERAEKSGRNKHRDYQPRTAAELGKSIRPPNNSPLMASFPEFMPPAAMRNAPS